MVKVGSGYTPPEDYFKDEDGTYPLTLLRIGVEDNNGDFTDWATRKFDSEFGTKTVQDWRFQLEDGSIIDAAVAVPKIGKRSGEPEIHPKSTYFGYVCALSGKTFDEGEDVPTQDKLIGRMALGSIARDDKGYPRVKSLVKMPASMLSQKVAAATGAPLKAEKAAADAQADDTIRAAVESASKGDALPF